MNCALTCARSVQVCSWCKDKHGISWQIIQRGWMDVLQAGGERAKRGMEAILKMKKFDVAALEAALQDS